MNIFFLNNCPKTSAQWLINKHLSKMIVESSQMLSGAYSLERLSQEDCPKTQSGKSRVHSYFNHPCSIWVRNSLTNFNWLLDHAIYLYEEKIYRLGGDHFCADFLSWCKVNPPNLEDKGLTTPALAFKNYPHFRDLNNPTLSYCKFYAQDKRFDNKGKWMAYYTKRSIPDFWEKYLTTEQFEEFNRMII